MAQPSRPIAVRGNLFAFLLPWNKLMCQLSEAFAKSDFRAWPLDQVTACEITTIRLVRGHEA
eukprot:10121228-Karenia_brevis.AAC.1